MNVTASRLSTSVHSARYRISAPPAKIGVGLQSVVHCVETSRRPASMNANRNKPSGRSWPREFVSPHRKTEHGTHLAQTHIANIFRNHEANGRSTPVSDRRSGWAGT